jgi:predicted nucleic acid-binding protein
MVELLNMYMSLDPGEASAIILAFEMNPVAFIIDERTASMGGGLGLSMILIGRIGVLARAKKME